MDHTDYEITLIRSRRKSLAIEITPELQVVVRAPARMPVREIDAFVKEKDDWIGAIGRWLFFPPLTVRAIVHSSLRDSDSD